MKPSALLLASLLAAPLAVGAAQADSLAAVARARYREAAAAERAGNLARARDLVAAAHQAWPNQPAYLVATADLSAR
ncbi:MAG: hypothetical protein JNJ80_25865, partial [Gemmatimonadetes bacterium]|nr:hypothetical protein [Gemmatimonadota bacterium]